MSTLTVLGLPALESLSDHIDGIGGLGIVTLFYFFRFNSLRGTRSYTTADLYYSGLAAFTLPFILAYFACLAFLNAMPATIIVMSLWIIPFIGTAWRALCHDVAEIPDYAYTFRNALAVAPFQLTRDDQPAVQRKLARCGYDFEDLTSARATVVQSRLVKIAAIVHHLEMWEVKYKTFIDKNLEQYIGFLEVFDLIAFKIVRNLKQGDRISAALGLADAKTSAVEDWEALESLTRRTKSDPDYGLRSVIQSTSAMIVEDLRKELDLILDNMLLFVSRGVLSKEATFNRRRRALEQMGFDIETGISSVLSAVIFVVAVVTVCSWLWLVAFGVSITGNKDVGSAKILTIGALNLLLNVIFIQYSKRNFAFANLDIKGQRPWNFIFTIALVPTMIIAFVRVGFEYFQFMGEVNSVTEFLSRITHSLPWSLNVWATGTSIALLSIETTWERVQSTWGRRILDGLVLGATWVGVLLLVFILNWHFRVEGLPPASLQVVIPTTLVFGFLIGFSIISGLRNTSLTADVIHNVGVADHRC
jgi:hypothetical protein